jgi:abequosyltransferase
MPLISVCIPAFNRATLLPPLLDSIIKQDCADFDIVIAEDFSPERVAIAAKVSEYQKRIGSKVRYYENPQTLGYDGNLRRLLELATGEYVLFMGNDDLLAPSALKQISTVLAAYSDVAVVLRSYSSFYHDVNNVEQTFRYFPEDRYFKPGAESITTFFRRSVFISGLLVKRSEALACSTKFFDGTLLYQQHLIGQILKRNAGYYISNTIAYHRLGGVPDFGTSKSEKGFHIPRQQTPESSLHFIRGMLSIARSLEEPRGVTVYDAILRDIGNYSFPILAIQADKDIAVYINYAFKLAMLGLWRAPLFYIYAFGLLILGRRRCVGLINQVKSYFNYTPILGQVFSGHSIKSVEVRNKKR